MEASNTVTFSSYAPPCFTHLIFGQRNGNLTRHGLPLVVGHLHVPRLARLLILPCWSRGGAGGGGGGRRELRRERWRRRRDNRQLPFPRLPTNAVHTPGRPFGSLRTVFDGRSVFKPATRLPQVRISVKQVAKHIQHSSSTAPAGMHQVKHPCILKLPREMLAHQGWSRVGVGVSLDIQRMGRESCRTFIIGGRRRGPAGGGGTSLSSWSAGGP